MHQPNRERKNEIKYLISLNEEQKKVREGICNKDVTIILGTWGTGKTCTAVLAALDLVFKQRLDKIYITRPINFEATGYLKGTIDEKMAMHIFPIKQNMYSVYGRDKVDKMFQEGVIQIIPIDYMKGMTIIDSVMIVDEFEDITFEDFRLILTRLGKGSKLIFTGSEEQIGIKNSCISKVKKLSNCEYVSFNTLISNHRNDIIPNILKHIEDGS